MVYFYLAAITFTFYMDSQNPSNRLNSCEICALCVEDLSYTHNGDPTSCLDNCVACEGNLGCETYVIESVSVTVTVSTD